MRLVIPYRLAGEGTELLYAIRSMVKHFKPLSGVLLIGDRPEWYQGDHLPAADLKGEKEKSMQRKIALCPDPVFLYSNDDYFALRDFDETLPNYCGAKCYEMAARHDIGSYRQMYQNCPPGWLNYDVHTPMIMRKVQFRYNLAKMTDQTPIKTTYMGGWLQGRTQWLYDMKIKEKYSLSELHFMIKDRPFFSTHEAALNDDLLALFRELYPEKSPYEK